MLYFLSQNDKKKDFSHRPGVLEKTGPGDGKSIYFKA